MRAVKKAMVTALVIAAVTMLLPAAAFGQTRSVASIDPSLLCPEGWVQVTPPLNPALRCLPGEMVAAEGGDPTRAPVNPIGCPDGWIPATPPLNPALRCLPNTLTSGG